MLASKTQHKTIPNTALPFVTNTSPTSASAQYVGGSNVLTSIKGQAELRPGFPDAMESSPVVLGAGETISRTFLWSKWSGQYYCMMSTVDASNSYVYKMAIGSDASFVKIHTCAGSTNPFRYQTANDTVYFGNEVDMKKFRATSVSDTNVYNWGIAAPSAAPTATLAGTGITGNYFYCYTFWNDNTSHESSPSPVSAVVSPANQTATVTMSNAGVDSQVTHFKLYRSTTQASGASAPSTSTFQLVSKQVIGTTTYADSTADSALGSEYAPGQNMNDPPPASIVGCYSQGRMWLFTGSTVWATGYEETSKGVPEESVPGGSLGKLGGGNAWNWDRPVKALATTVDGIAVFTPLRIYGIQGDSLDTFRIYRILDNRGAASDANVATFGNDIVWFDTSGQVFHSQLGEIGTDIRPSIADIPQSSSAIAIHISGTFHHVYLMDGATGTLYPYDLDTRQWMPPWSVGSTCSAISSGETAIGVVDLLLARNKTKLLKQNKTSYTDDGIKYAASLVLGLIHISQTSQLTEKYDKSNPQWRGCVDNVEIKTNTRIVYDVKLLMDDDPNNASSTSIAAGVADLPDVGQGSAVLAKRYPVGTLMEDAGKSKLGRMAALTLSWTASSSPFALYYIDIAYYPYAS